MSGEQLADLDELILRCKGPAAKQYIAEAVACYKAGAYRACIVATWIAVVYDIIGKLRDLDLTGDASAQIKLKEFEQIQSANDLTQSLKFEKQILDMAKDDFELITPLEHIDLTRLQQDRNRCAHPSMNSLDEIYEPSAELARTHLRNAIVYLLQRPPVQGSAAVKRLEEEVDSAYFPQDVAHAKAHFSSGPLANPRESLVRNFMKVLLKGLLVDADYAAHETARSAALNAVRQMHRAWAEKALAENLGPIMRKVPDDRLYAAVAFLSRVPDTWQYVPDDMRGKLERYIEEARDSNAARSLDSAFNVQELRPSATRGVAHIGRDDLAAIVKMTPRPEYTDRALDFYADSSGFNIANEIASSLILPLLTTITRAQVRRILQIARENDQVRFSFGFQELLSQLALNSKISDEEHERLRRESGFE